MQIIIVSDTHSQNEILEYLEKKYKNAYALIHCGDLEDDPRFYPHWLIVKGNNDYYGKFREDFRVRVGKHRIFVTHSHHCSYLYREQNLVRLAKEYGCDVVCYGHTHVSKVTERDGVLLVNPGSARLPRDGKSPSYAVMDIEDDQIRVEIVHQEDWVF